MNSGAGLGSGWCRRCGKPRVDRWCFATIMVQDADRYAAKAGRARMVADVCIMGIGMWLANIWWDA